MRWVFFLAGMGVLLLNTTAHGQSLADVARQEEQRRNAIVDPGRVYTNQDLHPPARPPRPTPPVAASPTPVDATPQESTPKGETGGAPSAQDDQRAVPVAPRLKRDEQIWRERTSQFLVRKTRLRADIAAMQSKLETLRAGSQTLATAGETREAMQDLAKFQNELRLIELEWTQFERRARESSVPPAWLQ